jgi:hypothetical protein
VCHYTPINITTLTSQVTSARVLMQQRYTKATLLNKSCIKDIILIQLKLGLQQQPIFVVHRKNL